MIGSERALQRYTWWLRWIALAAIALNLCMIGLRVASYTPLLEQQGSALYVAEPVVLLLAYAACVWWLTASVTQGRGIALRIGVICGLLSGALWLANHVIETFLDVSGGSGILATAPFLLGGFALWGVAGLWSARRTGAWALGLLAAIWSAMVCVLLTISFGFLLTFTSLSRLEHLLVDDPDFLRSHWSDLHAFAIANTFDAAFSHLLGALIVSGCLGSVGALIGKTLASRRIGGPQKGGGGDDERTTKGAVHAE